MGEAMTNGIRRTLAKLGESSGRCGSSCLLTELHNLTLPSPRRGQGNTRTAVR